VAARQSELERDADAAAADPDRPARLLAAAVEQRESARDLVGAADEEVGAAGGNVDDVAIGRRPLQVDDHLRRLGHQPRRTDAGKSPLILHRA
jgi:hypothetical protein